MLLKISVNMPLEHKCDGGALKLKKKTVHNIRNNSVMDEICKNNWLGVGTPCVPVLSCLIVSM